MSYHDLQNKSEGEIRDMLGWMDASPEDLQGLLVAAVMVLCDRVGVLKQRVIDLNTIVQEQLNKD